MAANGDIDVDAKDVNASGVAYGVGKGTGTTVQSDGNDKVLAALLSGLGATATLTMTAANIWLLAGSLAGA
jgi:hypothetical protein